MYEYGMSALVLKICQEYAQATGLNFPPCTQQEINAIAQWVNTHAVKDFKISQEGNVLTFTFYQDKEVTFTVELPEEYVLNVDDLYTLVKGSSTVVVDKSSDGKTLEIRLDKSQEVQYITLSPDSATQGTLTVDQFSTLQLNKGNCIILNNEIYRLADNQHTTGVISYVHTGWDSNIVNKSINITVSTRAWTMVKGEASGGGKLYQHWIKITLAGTDTYIVYLSINDNYGTEYTVTTFASKYKQGDNYAGFPAVCCRIVEGETQQDAAGAVSAYVSPYDITLYGVINDLVNAEPLPVHKAINPIEAFVDTVTEL